MRFFRSGSSASADAGLAGSKAQRASRRSGGLAELSRQLKQQENLCILDLGATSPANIRYFTELGHRVYSEDLLLASTDPALLTRDEDGKPALDRKRFLSENIAYPAEHFDVVLCWNLADYMDETLVKPVVDRLWSVMKPGGVLLAFFHTREAGPDAPCYRFHVAGADMLELQPIAAPRQLGSSSRSPAGGSFRLQRVFNNRHVENLFHDFASIKFFLARDNVREVIVVR